jgi:hypothetical protein
MGITQNTGASSLIRPGVIDNTAARPASPYEGQVIFQKDTDQLLVWNGTAWVIPNSPAQNPTGLEVVKKLSISSGNSYIDFGSCFSSTYDNYLISFVNISTTVSASILLGLLSGSTATSAGWYGTEFYCAIGSTTWSGQLAANNGAGAYCAASVGSTTTWSSIVEIQAPYLAAYTRFQYGTIDNSYVRNGYAYHGSNTSYDGLRFTLTSGTFNSGTVVVYGYRNS